MSKTFRPWLVDQPQLLPPSVMEFVPEGHVAHFVRICTVHNLLKLARAAQARAAQPHDSNPPPSPSARQLSAERPRGGYRDRLLGRGFAGASPFHPGSAAPVAV
jgi:hypothetical protein